MKKITCRDTAQPAEEAAGDEEECRIMIQSVEDTPCPVSEAECRVNVASSGCPMLGVGLGDNVPLGALIIAATASFERSEIFIRSY